MNLAPEDTTENVMQVSFEETYVYVGVVVVADGMIYISEDRGVEQS